VIAGTVCDLSAKVGVPVTLIQVAPPAPASAPQAIAELPRTGAGNLRAMLTLGFGAVLLGGVLLLGKRRLGAR
jgi:LPXTG-motif cell wall-anchored protein